MSPEKLPITIKILDFLILYGLDPIGSLVSEYDSSISKHKKYFLHEYPLKILMFFLRVWLLLFLVVIYVLVIAYYFSVVIQYRYPFNDEDFNDEKRAWCRENGVKVYNFRKYFNATSLGYESVITAKNDPTLPPIRFKREADMMAYKLRWTR